MAVSRRLRYEILRRDNHQCRYCGATAPDAPLTVDHVKPVALGGSDDATNLVTACKDCNAGKSSSSPDQPLVDDVNADALRWGRAMQAAAAQRVADRQALDAVVAQFDEQWSTWTITYPDGTTDVVQRDADWPASIRRFSLAGLEIETLASLMRDAMECKVVKSQYTWRSFCRRAWDEITARQELAAQIAEQSPVVPAAVGPHPWNPLIDAAKERWPWLQGDDGVDLADQATFYFQRVMELWVGGAFNGPDDETLNVRTLVKWLPEADVGVNDDARRIGQEIARTALAGCGVNEAFLVAAIGVVS